MFLLVVSGRLTDLPADSCVKHTHTHTHTHTHNHMFYARTRCGDRCKDLFEEYLSDPRYGVTAPDGATTWNLISIKQAIIGGLRPSAPAASENCPPAFFRLMTQCWSGNPADRPTFTTIVRRICKIVGIDCAKFLAHRSNLRAKQLQCVAQEPRLRLEVDSSQISCSTPDVATHLYTFPDLSAKQRVFSLLVVDTRIWAGCSDGTIVSFKIKVLPRARCFEKLLHLLIALIALCRIVAIKSVGVHTLRESIHCYVPREEMFGVVPKMDTFVFGHQIRYTQHRDTRVTCTLASLAV
jgi:hypothetical protein